MRAAVLLLLGFFLSGCAAPPSRSGRAPIDLVGSLPAISVTIGGKPARFVIDTGAETTIITPQAASRLGLALKPTDQKTYDAHLATRRVAGIARITHLRAAEVALPDTDAWCSALPLPPDIDGLLSRKAFADLLLTINYPKKQIELGSGRLDPSRGALPVGVHGQGVIRIPIVVGTTEKWFIIDTGFAGDFLVDEQTLTSAPDRKMISDHTSRGVNSEIRARVFALNTPIRIGQVAIDRPKVTSFPGARNMIGSGFLRSYRVTIDQKSRLLLLE